MERFSRKNIAILATVVAVAITLSLLSYQLSVRTSTLIQEISVRDTRSNAEIQVHDLSNTLSNTITDLTNNLKIISNVPAVQRNEVENAKILFNTAESASGGLADFYMWLDRDGRIVWISNINQTAYETYKGLDLSYRLYFEIPKQTHQAYYSSVTESNDKVNRLFVSYPILAQTDASAEEFKGVVVAAIRPEALGNFLEKQLSSKLQSQVALLDNTGIILYSNDAQFIGKNVFGVRFQSFLLSIDVSTLRTLNEGFKTALAGEAGSRDLVIDDKGTTFAYSPVVTSGHQFGELYVLAPHEQAADVAALIDQQRNLSLLLMVAIGGTAAGIVSIIFVWNKRLQDIVDSRTSELKVAYEHISNHDKMQREFINIAAHEIRTPVQPIIGIAGLLEAESDGKQKVEVEKEDLDIIIRNARRLERLTSDILQVARIEGKTLKLNEEVFDLNEKASVVVSDFVRTLSDDATKSNVRMEFVSSEPRQPILVKADKAKIYEVLSNLLRNSIKFTNQGTITVSCEADHVNGLASVRVKDTGSGIDADMIPRLFAKFASKSDSGTGLGLYVSKSIIEAHRGKIWGENNDDGRGATFVFTLPIIQSG